MSRKNKNESNRKTRLCEKKQDTLVDGDDDDGDRKQEW